MNILTLDHITKSFQNRKLLEDTSFYLQEQEKVGVIGINGTGKSTLLKLIAGEVDLLKRDSDEDVFIAKSGNPEIGYLKQMAFEDNTITVDEPICVPAFPDRL